MPRNSSDRLLSSRSPVLRQGFSLIEFLFALCIAGILFTLGFSNLRHTLDKQGPKSLAYALAADIRSARALAHRTGRYVACAFPSQGKSNSLTRSVLIREGVQRGRLSKMSLYGDEYYGTIFLGRWGESSEARITEPMSDGWVASLTDEVALVFRPDGTVFSPDLFPLNGRFAVVVAEGFLGDMGGPGARASHALHPNTVWISASGAVEVEEDRSPVVLPVGEGEFPVAEFKAEALGSHPPTLVEATLLPERIENLQTGNVGQNYRSIQQSEKYGRYLEYGLATIDVKVQDLDGGPLHYRVSASASNGGPGGAFGAPDQEGLLRYVYDETLRDYVWHALIVWRPPPGAPEDTVYELDVEVEDPEGHTLQVASDAVTLKFTSLPPARMVLCTSDRQLYLANLDGANEILLTERGDEEHFPFFSADGSQIFSFHDDASLFQLRRRTASGAKKFDILTSFDGAGREVKFDPTFMFASISSPAGSVSYTWGRVEESTSTRTEEDGTTTTETSYSFDSDEVSEPVNNTFVVNLMANDVIDVSDKASTPPSWNLRERHAFFFDNVVPTGMTSHPEFGSFRREPGLNIVPTHLQLDNYPSVLRSLDAATESAEGKIINPADRQWYLDIDGPTLRLKNLGGVSVVVDTSPGGYETDRRINSGPSWSAEGDRVVYIKKAADGREVVSKRVLDGGAPAASPSADFQYKSSNLRTAKLSPNGKWVYFLQNGALLRAENSESGSPPVSISSHLEHAVENYVLSP